MLSFRLKKQIKNVADTTFEDVKTLPGENGLCTTTSDTIVSKDNSQSSNNNSQKIPNVVTGISDNSEDDIGPNAYPIKTNVNLPKINDHTVHINPELKTGMKVVIISQAGKATGKNKYWLNNKSIDTSSFIVVKQKTETI